MKKGGGKQKGATFERKVCQELSLWLSKGKEKDLFWRSAMSGGRATVARRQGHTLAKQAGDVSAISKQGLLLTDRFVIECKTYRTLNFDSLIKGNGKLVEFWSKLRKEARSYKKLPMLVAKQNNFPIIVCFNLDGLTSLVNPKGIKKIRIIVPKSNMHIMYWEDFLKLPPKRNKKERQK